MRDVKALIVYYRNEATKHANEKPGFFSMLILRARDIGAEFEEKADILTNIERQLERMSPTEKKNALDTLSPIIAAMEAEMRGGAAVLPKEVLSYLEKITKEEL